MKINKCLFFLLCIALLTSCVGCHTENFSEVESSNSETVLQDDAPQVELPQVEVPQIDTQNAGKLPKRINEIPPTAEGMEMHYIAKTDSLIQIPKSYIFLTREMEESAEDLQESGLSKSDVISYLDAYGAEFVAITPSGNMEVLLKFQKTGSGIDSLNAQSNDAICSFAEGLQESFGAKAYELIEKDDVTWVKLAYSQPIFNSSVSADVVRYITIANGWDVFLWGSSYNGKLASQDLRELQSIYESFLFSKLY